MKFERHPHGCLFLVGATAFQHGRNLRVSLQSVHSFKNSVDIGGEMCYFICCGKSLGLSEAGPMARAGRGPPMFVSDGWTDYQLLDAANGRRLERWGGVVLSRPDPQVIWRAPLAHEGWQNCDGEYIRQGGGGHWRWRCQPEPWPIGYRDLTFRIKPTDFKHTGLFPEQAHNWDRMTALIQKRERPVKLLNLFAYTGGATVAAAAAGAEVTHVDAAKGMVAWARENAALSGLSDRPVRWIVDDCAKFVAREVRRGKRYDAIAMDPPSYGRGPGGEVWKLEDRIYDFLQSCRPLLSDDPCFVLLNAYTTGLAPGILQTMLSLVFAGGHCESGELGLPIASTGLVLPAGACCWWRPYD